MKTLIAILVMTITFSPATLAKNKQTQRVIRKYKNVLKRMDNSQLSKSRQMHMKMVVKDDEGVHIKHVEITGQGSFRTLAKVTSPASQKGTKLLRTRLNGRDTLYFSSPNASRAIRLSGNMLKQPFLNSDVSYEDVLDSPELGKEYEIVKAREVEMNGKKCFDLRLRAKRAYSPYPERRYVVTEDNEPVMQVFYARGGKKVKTVRYGKMASFGNRRCPTEVLVDNHLRKNSKTMLLYSNVRFNVSLPNNAFTRGYLEREW